VIDLKFWEKISESSFNFLSKIIPRPEISLLLMGSPKTSYDRDRDWNLKIHREKPKLYLEYESLFDYKIDVDRNLDVLQKEIKSVITKRLNDGCK
jgi:hypothetical protein